MNGMMSEQDLQDEIALKIFDDDESALQDMLKYYAPRIEDALFGRYEGYLTKEDIEEVVCYAVKKFWDAHRDYNDKKASIRHFLYVIAGHRAIDVLRLGWQKARQMETQVDFDHLVNAVSIDRHVNQPASEDCEDSNESEERHRAVNKVLATLPEIQQRILKEDAMASGDGVEASELGKRLGIPAGTVRVYRLRAKDAFRKGMKKRGFGL